MVKSPVVFELLAIDASSPDANLASMGIATKLAPMPTTCRRDNVNGSGCMVILIH